MSETLAELKNILTALERQNENSKWSDEDLCTLYDLTEYKIRNMERELNGTC